MRKSTHVLGATAASLALGYTAPECLILAAFGGLLPDIDHPKSALGHKNPFAGFLRHRGFCHSLAFAGILYFAGSTLFSHSALTVQALIIGVLSHIALDMMNKTGVQLLWPLKGMVKFPILKIKTGTANEYIVRAILLFVNVWLYYHLSTGKSI